MDLLDKMDMLIEKKEEKWSGDVELHYHPRHDAIKKALKKDDTEESANEILKALDDDDASPETIVKRITFFINRAGTKLSVEDRRKLEAARKKAEKKEHKNKGTVGTLKKKKKLEEDVVPMQNNGQQNQNQQGQQQNNQQPQVDINAAANAVTSTVLSKTQDATTAISIINQALANIKQKFNIK